MPKEKLGGLTGSERVAAKGKGGRRKKTEVTESEQVLETVKNTTKAITDGIGTVVDGVQTVANGAKILSSNARQVQRTFTGSSGVVSSGSDEATNEALAIGAKYGFQVERIEDSLSTSNHVIDESLPEMDAKTANQMTLKIERQNNALDVANKRIIQKRKQVRNHKAQLELVGDVVDMDTTRINTASKFVDHEIANTKFQTKQSKLEEAEELLSQQVIKTQGTISLTEGIRQEWDLKFQKQQRQLEKIQIEIEQANNENARQRDKLENFLFEE